MQVESPPKQVQIASTYQFETIPQGNAFDIHSGIRTG